MMDARTGHSSKLYTQQIAPISFPLGRAWYVVSAFSRSEDDIEREVIDLGFEAYVPRQKVKRIVRGRRVEQEVALFPGYLFVSFDHDRDNWAFILDIDGVIEILRNSNVPVRVNATIIDRLRRAEAAGQFDKTKPGAEFSEGQEVEIMEGPMAGLIAKIKSARAKNRIKILTNLFGTAIVSDIDACKLRRVA